MRKWSEVRDEVVDSERFAELAMTGTVDDGTDLLMEALENTNRLVSEPYRVEVSRSQIRKEVKRLRVPVEIKPYIGEQLELFGG